MENYDEKMNYSFEPVAPETPQPPLEQAKEEIRRSGKHTGLKIAALLAAVAIVAGVGGSVLTKAIDAIGQKNLAEQESSASVGAMLSSLSNRNSPQRRSRRPTPPTGSNGRPCRKRSSPTSATRRLHRRRSIR